MRLPVQSIPRRVDAFLRPLLEFIYPPECFVCEARLEDGTSRVCPACWSTIRPVSEQDILYQEMHRRLMESGQISRLVSLYHFEKDGTLQSIIHQLKYDGMTRLGVELGWKLGERLLAATAPTKIDGIIPVPLHSTKLRERGYNQSEHIARGIQDVTSIPVCASFLKRHKYTSSQTQLTAVERKQNVGDAFSVKKISGSEIEGKRFLVLDDVITTGATVEACAEALKESGALEVVAGSVALADHSALP